MGLIGAAALIVCVELVVGTNRAWFVDEVTAMWEEKARLISEEPLSADILALGSSRLMHGLIPEYLDQQIDRQCTTYNLALSGMHPQGALILLERALDRQRQRPRLVLLEISPAHLGYSMEKVYASPYLRSLYNARDIVRAMRWDFDPTVALEWGLYRLLPSARYRQGLDNFLSRALTEGHAPRRYRNRNRNLVAEFYAGRGYRRWLQSALPEDYFAANPPIPEAFTADPAMTDALQSIFRLCKRHRIRCVLLPAPLPEQRVRARRDSGYEDAMLAWLYRLTDPYPDVIIAPIVSLPNHSFCDPTHLNPAGAREFSIDVGGWLALRRNRLGLASPFGRGLLIRLDPHARR